MTIENKIAETAENVENAAANAVESVAQELTLEQIMAALKKVDIRSADPELLKQLNVISKTASTAASAKEQENIRLGHIKAANEIKIVKAGLNQVVKEADVKDVASLLKLITTLNATVIEAIGKYNAEHKVNVIVADGELTIRKSSGGTGKRDTPDRTNLRSWALLDKWLQEDKIEKVHLYVKNQPRMACGYKMIPDSKGEAQFCVWAPSAIDKKDHAWRPIGPAAKALSTWPSINTWENVTVTVTLPDGKQINMRLDDYYASKDENNAATPASE